MLIPLPHHDHHKETQSIGLIWGFALRSLAPETYKRIGHMVYND